MAWLPRASLASAFRVEITSGRIVLATRLSEPMPESGDVPLAMRQNYVDEVAAPFYLGYQGMKVASQTVERSIQLSDPNAVIERHHWLTAATLQAFKSTCDFSTGQGYVFDSFRQQVRGAEQVHSKLQQARLIYVLVGFRDPLDHAVSAFFQNVAFFCPWLTYDASALDAETQRVLDVFYGEFSAMMRRVAIGSPALTMRDLLLDLKLGGIHRWFLREFNEFFSLDVYEVKIGDSDVIRFSQGKYEFVLYRVEALKQTLPDLLAQLPLQNERRIESLNVAVEKPYGAIYQRFKALLRSTPEMVKYYYGGSFWGPYFQHFYSGARPLYG